MLRLSTFESMLDYNNPLFFKSVTSWFCALKIQVIAPENQCNIVGLHVHMRAAFSLSLKK